PDTARARLTISLRSVRLPCPRPTAPSPSHTNTRGPAPSWLISCHQWHTNPPPTGTGSTPRRRTGSGHTPSSTPAAASTSGSDLTRPATRYRENQKLSATDDAGVKEG